MRLRDRVGRLPTPLMALALRCPYEWYPPLMDKEPPCRRGDDCEACLRSMLEEPDPGGEDTTETDLALRALSADARARIREVLDDAGREA